MKKSLITVFLISVAATSSVYAGMEQEGRHLMGKRAFSIIDSNQDGSLSKEEVSTFHSERFDKMDANSDGLVTKQEAKAFRKKQRFIRIDSNGDGIITEEEMSLSRQYHHKSGRGERH